MKAILKSAIQGGLHKLGYQLVTNTRPPQRTGFSHGGEWQLPPEYAERLRSDHPRLLELRERYCQSSLPMACHTWWEDDYIEANLDLQQFRGDNAYVWQTRHMGESVVQRYYLYLRDLEARDELGLLKRFSEDGAFGSWVYRYHRHTGVSRDLLDSVNEINFLQRHAGVTGIADLTILDIGAGYGRMAHRCCTALDNLKHYYCTDAVAESTFLSETYLQYRQLQDRAEVIPLDELQRLSDSNIDLAINVHSFSEMQLSAVEGWFELIARLKIPHLFIVPNDSEAFLTMEADGLRKDFLPVIERAGYRLKAKEPVIADDDVRELIGVQDHMFLFAREG